MNAVNKVDPLPKWLERTIKRVIWFRSGRLLHANTRRGIKVAEETLPIIRSQWDAAERIGITKYTALYNGMCFVLLLYYDFSQLVLLHATEVDDTKQNFFARLLSSLLYEAIEDLPQVLGKEFRTSLAVLPNGSQHLRDLSDLMKTLGSFRRDYEAQLYQVRNYVAAHRDHNVKRQVEIMDSIDQIEMVKLSERFVEFIGRLAAVSTPIVLEMGRPGVLIKALGQSAP